MRAGVSVNYKKNHEVRIRCMRICFLVGSVDISGGTYVIFQHADYLCSVGHEVTLGIQNPFDAQTTAWHPSAKNLTLLNFNEASKLEYDVVIATWWKTALELPLFKSSQYAYFVQSIESWFYPENEIALKQLVDSTYTLPLHFVSEATWIKNYLQSTYQQSTTLVKNGIRKDLYRPSGPVVAPRFNDGRIRVLVEGPFGVHFKNTGRTIKIVKRAKPSEIWLLTSSELNWMPGVDRVFSRVPINEVPAIYRSCDVIVKLSYIEGMFGPPLEAFHCGGTAIVYEVTGHDEFIRHGINGLVAPKDNEEIVVKFIQKLKKEPAYLRQLKSSALETANNWMSWNESSEKFRQWVESLEKSDEISNVDILKNKIADFWATYIHEEKAQHWRIKWWRRLIYKFDALLEVIPPVVAKKIRQFRYLGERFS